MCSSVLRSIRWYYATFEAMVLRSESAVSLLGERGPPPGAFGTLGLLRSVERQSSSGPATALAAERATLLISPLIYAEVSVRFDRIESLDPALPPSLFCRDGVPWESGLLAAKCLRVYRREAMRGSTHPTRDAT
jgi:hypothetical protein